MLMSENIVVVEIPPPIVKSPKIIRKRGLETYLRIGRGYSIGEIKQVGLNIKLAKQFNIPLDIRRRSVHQYNVENLKRIVEILSILITAKKTKPAKIVQQQVSVQQIQQQ
jgi:large subunit ribosomal protein L13e